MDRSTVAQLTTELLQKEQIHFLKKTKKNKYWMLKNIIVGFKRYLLCIMASYTKGQKKKSRQKNKCSTLS